jgi:hypothetical protein
VSPASVSSRASPVPWTLCCPVLGRHPSHSSSDSGHNAWVSDSESALPSCVSLIPFDLLAAVVVAGFLIVCLSRRMPLETTDNPFCQPIFYVWFNAESILLFLHQQPDVAHLAAIYLKYASIGLPAYAFNAISRYAQRPNSRNALTVLTVDISNPRVSLRSRPRSFSWSRLLT